MTCTPFFSFLQGVTRLMLTKIPYFREVIISSFQCDHCGYSDCGVQSGSRVQDKGVQYTLTVKSTKVCCLSDICVYQMLVLYSWVLAFWHLISIYLETRECPRKVCLNGITKDYKIFCGLTVFAQKMDTCLMYVCVHVWMNVVCVFAIFD